MKRRTLEPPVRRTVASDEPATLVQQLEQQAQKEVEAEQKRTAEDRVRRNEAKAATKTRTPPPPLFTRNVELRVTFPYASIMSRAIAKAVLLGELCVLDFSQQHGLRVRQRHSSNVCMIDVRVPRAAFLAFEMQRPSQTFILRRNQVRAFQRACKVEHTLTFIAVAGVDVLRARACGPKSDRCFTFDTMDADAADSMVLDIDGQAMTHPARVVLASEVLSEEVSNADAAKGSEIELNVRDARLTFLTYADTTSTGRSRLDSTVSNVVSLAHDGDIVTPAPQYNLEFLKLLVTLRDVCRHVSVHFGCALPLYLRFTIDSPIDGAPPLGTIDAFLTDRLPD